MKKLPGFEDLKLREACAERCELSCDVPCYELPVAAVQREGSAVPAIKPCGECLRDIGIEPGDEFDENAAIGRML